MRSERKQRKATRAHFNLPTCGAGKMSAPQLLLVIVLFSGCTAAHVERSLTEDFGSNDSEAQLEFWHALQDRPVASNDEAFHALLLYLNENEDPASNYQQRMSWLKSHDMLDQKFERPANEGVTRGTLAVALVKALQIKGGVMMHLLGPTPRYAIRELQFVGLYPRSSPHQSFTGAELVSIIGRVEDFQRAHRLDLDPKQLPEGTTGR